MMQELKLPIIKERLPAAKSLSMDDYLRFVNLHLKYTLNKEVVKKWKKLSAVNVSFFVF